MKYSLILLLVESIFLCISGDYSDICVSETDMILVQHPESDKKLLICLNHVAFELSCAEAFYFNVHLGKCMLINNAINRPDELNGVNHCEGIINGVARDPTNCRYFYFCLNGKPSRAQCPLGQYFDPEKNRCNLAELVNCTDINEDTTSQIMTTNIETTEVYKESTSTKDTTPITTTVEYITITNESTTTVIPEIPTTTIQDTTATGKYTSIALETSTTIVIEIPTTTCYGVPDGTLINNPQSCDRFFFCLMNIAISSICPAPQFFNELTAKCDNPENVDCTDVIPEEPNLCNGMPNGHLINNQESCSHFFICFDNMTLPGKCPFELFFDEENQKCASPDTVDCVNFTTPVPENPDKTTEEPVSDVCFGKPDSVLVNNPSSCDAFYICFRETPIAAFCPPPALFNPHIGICDKPDNVNCLDETTIEYETSTKTSDICYDEIDSTFLNDPKTCEGYFLCLNGQSILLNCPSGMYFNPAILLCQNFEIVNCTNDNNYTSTTATNEMTTAADKTTRTTDKISTTTEESSTTFDQSTTSFADSTTTKAETTTILATTDVTTVPSIPDTCPLTGILAIPSSDRCSRFTLCTFGEVLHLACPAGQHFVFELQECLPHEMANCTISIPFCDPVASLNSILVFPHPQHCERFFICINGTMIPSECFDGKHFDIVNEQCTTPTIAHCESF